jgi:hypothetical protein
MRKDGTTSEDVRISMRIQEMADLEVLSCGRLYFVLQLQSVIIPVIYQRVIIVCSSARLKSK